MNKNGIIKLVLQQIILMETDLLSSLKNFKTVNEIFYGDLHEYKN